MGYDVKKKLASLVLCLMMCLSVFTGCSLTTRNNQAYFEAVVAQIEYTDGQTENITKRDLLVAYKNYGSQYEEQYGRQEAIELTLDSLINQKLTYRAVEDYYAETGEEVFNERETTYLWDETYDALYSNLKTYFDEVMDNTGSSSGDSSTTEENASAFEQYKSQAYLDYDANGNLVIRKTTAATTTRATYTARKDGDVYYDFEYEENGTYPFKEKMYNILSTIADADQTSAANWRSALNNYIADIKDNYDYRDFATDKDAFMFEMDRVYNIIKDNYMTEKYSAIFNRSEHQGADYSSVSVNDILKAYSANVRADYTTYKLEQSSSYQTNMLGDIANMDYVLDDGSDYFYVAYIKLNFSTQNAADYADIEAEYANGDITGKRYQEKLNDLYNSVLATQRNEAGETVGTVSQTTLEERIDKAIGAHPYLTLEQYKNDLTEEELALAEEQAQAQSMTLDQFLQSEVDDANVQVGYDRAEAFREFLYLYNDDDTLKNADYNSVFGVDASGNVLMSDTFSSDEVLAKNIEDAIKTLYQDGTIGATTEFVRASDGVYMFFYAGEIENLFLNIDENFDASMRPENVRKLTSTRLNVFSEKTVFDVVYESLVSDQFSVFQNMNINYLRQAAERIEIFVHNINDLY